MGNKISENIKKFRNIDYMYLKYLCIQHNNLLYSHEMYEFNKKFESKVWNNL